MKHQDLTINHRLENWVYANAAARNAATGFVTGDISRIAFQTDTGVYYRLKTISPITWASLPPALETWVYANAAARNAATGFVTDDIGRIAYQTDTGVHYRLKTISPVTWVSLPPALETWVYANAAARNAATGFVTDDIGRIAFQTDTGVYYRLKTISPITWLSIPPAITVGYATKQTSAQNPTGTTSTTNVMMGLGGGAAAAVITPVSTGKTLLSVTGIITNTVADKASVASLMYGTGTIPANGDGPAGTWTGVIVQKSGVMPANTAVPFAMTAYIAVAVGVQIWIDLALNTDSTGTALIKNVTITAIELP